MGRFIMIDGGDNVATALIGEKEGESVTIYFEEKRFEVMLKDTIAPGHKIAVRHILCGQQVIKYGYPIGTATEDILPGQHVHIHNVESTRGRGDKA
ncbi:MAG: D-galactarate dehydratase [Ruminiclostridium sp.]|nr:D-galactarate dehydratase [Ruminiclostridium sp.]